jgi:beta-carotene ketolase (CrtW type)
MAGELMNLSALPSYRSPRWYMTSTQGAWIAASVILAWLVAGVTLWWHWSELSWWARASAIPLMSFFYTGLFITAHDAMHGLIIPGSAGANRRWGQLALALYAGFSFEQLNREHHRHHARPASKDDPDYHGRALGDDLPFWSWWGRFMWTYRSWRPFAFFATIAALNLFAGGDWSAYVMIWALPSLLSTLQLFYFGTYRPHRQADVLDREQGERVRARSDDFPIWLSFITCYHFGYHEEHHRRPDVPWWALPQARRAQQASRGEL